MSMHRVTVELPQASYRHLRQMVESGLYPSESDAVADVLLDASLTQDAALKVPDSDRWMRDEVLAADDVLEADPTSGLTPEQLHAELGAARQARMQSR